MKKLISTLILTLLFKITVACSCYPCWNPFCATTTLLDSDLILTGTVIYSDTFSIKLSVLDVFKGEVESDTVTIWNGTPFDCNGLFPMKANELGSVNDTIIVILPRITMDNLENDWDVIGDYRRPNSLCVTPNLHVYGDTIYGLINRACYPWDWWTYTKMQYLDFVYLWSNGNLDCSSLVNIKHIHSDDTNILIQTIPNPFATSTIIEYQLDQPSQVTLTIFNHLGKQVDLIRQYQQPGKQSLKWQPQGLPPGMYYFTIKAGDQVATGKMVLMN